MKMLVSRKYFFVCWAYRVVKMFVDESFWIAIMFDELFRNFCCFPFKVQEPLSEEKYLTEIAVLEMNVIALS